MDQKDKRWLKFYPEDVNANIDIAEKSLTEFLSDSVERFDAKPSLEFDGQTWSYKEVQQMAEKLGGCLFQHGLTKGDRLSIMLPNCPEYIFSLFGVVRLGGIVVQTNPMYVERELVAQLKDTDAKIIICHDAVYELVKKVRNITSLEKIIVVQLEVDKVIKLDEEDCYFDDFLATYKCDAPQVAIDPTEDIAVLQYTGGTTGVSKGVMLTHQNFINQTEQVNEYFFKRFESRTDLNRTVISFLPLFHIFGLANVTLMGFRFGYKQIILPRFEITTVLNLIKKESPFFFFGVPTMFNAMFSYPNVESYGLANVEGFFCGSSPMPLESYNRFKKLMNKTAFLSDGYGLSEATSATLSNPYTRMKTGSVGIPLPGTEAKIMIETDKGMEMAPVGTKGELLFKGPQVMKGYWNREQETQEVLKDGWLHSGDIAYTDEDGYFYIAGRKKDMIIASGHNVYPQEVEEVIYQIPEVQEAMVIGLPDDYRGETVKAYIMLKVNQVITEEEVIKFCRENLATYKVPRMIEFRDELPKSEVGKLLKRVLRDQELDKLSIK